MRRPVRVLAFLLTAALPLGLLLAADLPMVAAVERRLATAALEAVPAEAVEVEVEGFPVVARALVKGEVVRANYQWEAPQLGEVSAASLNIDLRGIGLARSELLAGDVRIRGVETGELEAQISLGEVGRLFDRDVRVHEGQIVVAVTPATEVAAAISASAGGLVLTAGALDPVVAQFDPGVVPCAPTSELEDSVLVLRCSFRGLPPLFRS